MIILSPEFYTLYTIKKHITSNIDKLAEFKFINIINERNRKCSISWDYRLFLMKDLMLNEKFIEYDLNLLTEINEKEKRNYHLWKYVIHISKLYTDYDSKRKIVKFCFISFLKNIYDYSAYSASVNLLNLMNSDDKRELLISIYNTCKILESKSNYLDSLINLLT
jgi:hypothetical protein